MSTDETCRVTSPGSLTDYDLRYNYAERLKCYLANLWNWRTAWAVRYLSKQLQRDKAFRDSWHANIAMPIYDSLAYKCNCSRYPHSESCPVTLYAGDLVDFSKQANEVADRLMKNLFGA